MKNDPTVMYFIGTFWDSSEGDGKGFTGLRGKTNAENINGIGKIYKVELIGEIIEKKTYERKIYK